MKQQIITVRKKFWQRDQLQKQLVLLFSKTRTAKYIHHSNEDRELVHHYSNFGPRIS